MNKITQIFNETTDKVEYLVTTEDGTKFYGKPWYEKKTNKTWIKLPDDNPTGRKYIDTKLIEQNGGEYEFESKTSGPRVLNSTGSQGWRSRLEPDELERLKEAEQTIETLKALAMSRPKKELTEEEKIQKQIDALLKKQAELLKKKEG